MDDGLLKQARAKAAKYCAYRERAPQQVMEKLLGWNIPEENARKILQMLIEDGFVDELRFCKAFCHDKFEFNQWGKRRIEMELRRYNLPSETIANGLRQIDPVRYEETIKHLAEKKWSSTSTEKDFLKRKSKTAAYLIRKGFESDLVWEAVNQMSANKQ